VLNTSGADNAGPTYWEDDSTGTLFFYFTQKRNGANPNGFNIYSSTCTADVTSCNRHQLWSTATYVAELNSAGFRNTRTAIRRRDGLEMLITSNRPGTVDVLDLGVSTRDSVQEEIPHLVSFLCTETVVPFGGKVRRLIGWKEISNHLRYGVRTLQRWEREGLPIRRVNQTRRSPVVADSDELEAWILHRRKLPPGAPDSLRDSLERTRELQREVQKNRKELQCRLATLRKELAEFRAKRKK